uniref:EF-hand domain-containing protein n=1 Tax=Hemiselmis andersenii TaxID=464988 RepID=A0A6U4VEQ5_HEMAN
MAKKKQQKKAQELEGSLPGVGTGMGGRKVAPAAQEDESMLEDLSRAPKAEKSDSFKLDGSKPQSMLHVKREFKRFLSEFALYSIWLLSFALTILMTRDNTMTFQFANLFRKNIITGNGWDTDLTTVDQFWDFLLEATGAVLANDIFTRAFDDFFAAEPSFLYGNKRVGSLRIRQVRVPPSKCSTFYTSQLLAEGDEQVKKNIQCYPEFDTGAKLEKTFKKEGDFQIIDTEAQPWFKYWESKELNEMPFFSATFASYPGSGFYIDVNEAWWTADGTDLLLEIVPMGDDLVKKPMMNITLSQLKNSNWIDLKTRAVFFDFSFYNPNMNIFLVVRIVVEFLPSGIVSSYSTFRTVDPFRYGFSSSGELIVVALFATFAVLAMYYATREAKLIYRNASKYFSSFWSLVTFTIVVCTLALVGLTGYTIYVTRNIFDNLSASPDQGALQSLGFLLDQEKNFSGIIIVIMVIRVYKFCTVSRSLSTLTRTLGKSAKFLAVLVILFLVASFGFALSSTLILGQDNYNFYSTSWAMFTLLRAGFGDFDYTEWLSHRFLGPFLLLCWLFFANAFLLNIVVAVICEAFVEVTEENKEADAAGHMTLVDALWDLGPVRRLLQMQKKKRDKIVKLEKTLEEVDVDGDGMTDVKELEGWLHETGARL